MAPLAFRPVTSGLGSLRFSRKPGLSNSCWRRGGRHQANLPPSGTHWCVVGDRHLYTPCSGGCKNKEAFACPGNGVLLMSSLGLSWDFSLNPLSQLGSLLSLECLEVRRPRCPKLSPFYISAPR
jgi:hypothetical protein